MWVTLARQAKYRGAVPPVRPHRILRAHRFRMASTLPRLPIFEAIAKHRPESTAIVHSVSQRTFTYGQLLRDVADAKEKLRENTDGQALDGQRVAFLIDNSYDYVGAQCL
jgi:malonyl-CoA/methylmalonyl-CoA synthetase